MKRPSTRHFNSFPNVIVIGGGLGGMATSVALTQAGAAVTLIEARRTLGGRAGSFEDPQTGEILDNCQHVLLGCCSNLKDFYRRIGASKRIRWERTIRFMAADGRMCGLSGVDGLPAPLHLGPSLLRFSLLTVTERIALTRAMLAMMRLGDHGRAALSAISFGDWLDAHGQPASLVHKLYDPVIVSGLNENTRRVSASAAIHVFYDSLLANSAGYLVGVPDCPLGELYATLPDVKVRTSTRVEQLVIRDKAVTGVVLVGGEVLQADAIVLATGHHAARRLVPELELAELDDVPILGVHLWFDRPVMTHPHIALIDGPLQWLFRKDHAGKALHGVISAARDWVGKPKDQSLGLFEAQVRTLFPAARNAKLQRGVIVIEKRATFSPLPGIDRFRPMQGPAPGGINNLYLAGDYTQSGWPATMEGAVRSGYLAAEAITRTFLPHAGKLPFVVPDLPRQWPSRLLEG